MARPVARPPVDPPATVRTRAGARTRSRRAAIVLAAATGLGLLGAGWLGVSGGFGAPVASRSSGPVGDASPSPSVASSLASGGPGSDRGSLAPGASPPASSAGPGEDRQAVEARLQRVLDRLRVKLAIPGVSATVLFPDGSAWTGVTGLADIAGGVAIAPTTAFAIASMSKTFTSAEILSLVDAGRLRLTDAAAGLLPAGLPIRLDPRITVAMLLDHTSGLPDFFLNPKIDAALQAAPTRRWTPADALRYVGKPLSKPGAAWHYANTNYLLLGLIAERITGRPLAAEIRDRFLDPLGLTATWYQAVEAPREALAHAYRVTSLKPNVKPIDLTDGTGVMPFRSVVTASGAAGSIAATSLDLARWGRALYGGDVLGPVGTALLLSDFNRTVAYIPGVSYGYGVQALSIDGHPSLGHSGRLLGARGAVRDFPIDGYTIAVLTNQSRADPGAILRSLLAVVEPPVTPPGSPSPSASAAPSGPVASRAPEATAVPSIGG